MIRKSVLTRITLLILAGTGATISCAQSADGAKVTKEQAALSAQVPSVARMETKRLFDIAEAAYEKGDYAVALRNFASGYEKTPYQDKDAIGALALYHYAYSKEKVEKFDRELYVEARGAIDRELAGSDKIAPEMKELIDEVDAKIAGYGSDQAERINAELRIDDQAMIDSAIDMNRLEREWLSNEAKFKKDYQRVDITVSVRIGRIDLNFGGLSATVYQVGEASRIGIKLSTDDAAKLSKGQRAIIRGSVKVHTLTGAAPEISNGEIVAIYK